MSLALLRSLLLIHVYYVIHSLTAVGISNVCT